MYVDINVFKSIFKLKILLKFVSSRVQPTHAWKFFMIKKASENHDIDTYNIKISTTDFNAGNFFMIKKASENPDIDTYNIKMSTPDFNATFDKNKSIIL
jgi:hypothetical protein